MPLDNAQFISELSITDPPGSDPLNQGDDHIRTTKRATQQSFPNVNAAVPQTAAQMAQMAIKNENNIFTQVNTFQAQLRSFDGSLINPTYSFTTDTGTGMFLEQAGVLAFTSGGALTFRIAPLNVRFADQMRADLRNSASRPSYSFNADTGMGMYSAASNVLNFATAGVDRIALTASEMNIKSTQVWAAAGSTLKPSWTFASDQSTGMYNITAGALGFASSGREIVAMRPNGSINFKQLTATAGVSLNLQNSGGFTAYSIQYEGTSGFQPRQLSFSRFNADTGAFIDIPLYIGIDGRVHSLLPVLTP